MPAPAIRAQSNRYTDKASLVWPRDIQISASSKRLQYPQQRSELVCALRDLANSDPVALGANSRHPDLVESA